MNISAKISSSPNFHEASVETNGAAKTLSIAAKPGGFGSSVNGGEFLLLSLATCFCNDIYREAAKQEIAVSGVEVEVSAVFGAEGEPGTGFQYKAKVKSDAPQQVIDELIRHTDRIAEIHQTLRKGVNVTLMH